MAAQGGRRGNGGLSPTAPSERKEELVEGMPKNLEPNRDSCHQCAIHRMLWAPSQGHVNYLPRDMLIIFPQWATRLEMSKGRLQLTLLCSAWENQWSSAPSLALVQRCGIFQENFKIITERGRHLKTILKRRKKRKGRPGFPGMPRAPGLGRRKRKLCVFISCTESPEQHSDLTWGPRSSLPPGI